MKRILHILSTNTLSGAENVAADICMMFRDEYEMAYCSLDGPIKDSLCDRGVNFIPLKKLNVLGLRECLKTFKPDIIHAHDIRASVYASFISFNIPVISHLHGNQKAMRKISIKSILYLISTFKVKTIIAVSDSCINDFVFKRIIKRKAVVIKNVIHLKRLEILMDKDEENYNFDFVFLGRLSYPKDPKRVALVASNVLKKCSFAKFGVIGDGELQKEMINVFEEQNVIDRVVFTGKLPYPYKALKSAKCLLMCSIYEGLPIAALEAMALGVPVVSTPVDGLVNIIINDVNGYLSNSNIHLSNYIVNLLENNSKSKNLSLSTIQYFNLLNNENDYINNIRLIYNKINHTR